MSNIKYLESKRQELMKEAQKLLERAQLVQYEIDAEQDTSDFTTSDDEEEYEDSWEDSGC